MNRTAMRVSWVLMLVVLVGALVVGATGHREPATESERVRSIASGVRCPTCRGLSAAESDAMAAQAVRDSIRDQLRAGRTPSQIRAFLVARYGDDILLKPRASGLSALVWVLPVAALLVAIVGLAFAFRRWKDLQLHAATPTDEDRALVEEALRG